MEIKTKGLYESSNLTCGAEKIITFFTVQSRRRRISQYLGENREKDLQIDLL